MGAEFSFQYRFHCVECGDCCRFPGHVLLTADDLARLSEGLGCSEQDVINRYTRLASNRRQLSLVDGPAGGCIFLRDDACQVYAHRPDQCRAFPFSTTTQSDCPGLSVEVVWATPDGEAIGGGWES